MPSEFTTGNLISWSGGKTGNVGVIISLDEIRRLISIRIDSEPEDMTFALSTAPEVLTRVIFEDGKFVQRPDGSVGVVVSRSSVEGLFIYQVNLPGGGQPSVVETGLRPAVVLNPLTLLREGEVHSARSTNLRLAATRLLFDHQFNQLASLSNSRIEIKPHQVGVLHKATTNYPHRYLLADEVGLGKTIEAGLIIKELKARGVAHRVLILAPSGIVSQWQMEMKSKFSQVFSLYNRDTVAFLQADHASDNVWALRDNVIASNTFAAMGEERRNEIALAGWDLVVIDEAHHARRTWHSESSYSETNLYKLAKSLSDPDMGRSTGLLLLTATPMQLHRFELYSLVELLDPALFPNYSDFEEHCKSLAGLNRAAENVRVWETLEDDAQAGAIQDIALWLERPVQEIENLLDTLPGRTALTEDLFRCHSLSEVLIRNRKAVVGGFMPRVAVMWPVTMSEQEWKAYNAIAEYVQSGYAMSRSTNNNALGFLMAIFQKLGCSSSYALRQSLLKRIGKLEDGLFPPAGEDLDVEDEDIEERPMEEAIGDLLGAGDNGAVIEEIRDLAGIVKILDGIPVDSKTQVLNDKLSEILDQDGDAKVIIFTQFRDTQESLRLHINPSWGIQVFHGQLKPAEKDEAVRQFKESTGAQVLISTEAGGEGRNFQFCNTLINYDLPWNPMKIEQRIGRLDRIGQKNPVKVINFSILGTIEERVLEVLSRRIRLFEETIGGLDPILGDVEDSLKNVFLLASTEADRVLSRLETDLGVRVAAARAAETQLADLIMDTKSFRQDEVNTLLENRSSLDHKTMKRFVLAALAEMEVGIEDDPVLEDVFELRLRGRFFIQFPQFAREGNLRRVTFDPAVALDYETIEFMAFGHEIVEALIQHVTNDEYQSRTSHRVIVTDERAPKRGWFFTFVLELNGVVRNKELFPVFVDIEGVSDEDLAVWLLDRASKLKSEASDEQCSIPEREVAFEQASALAEEQAVKRLLKRQAELSSTNQDKLNLEKVKIERYYEYRQMVAAEKVKSVRNILERISASGSAGDQRIIPVWTSNLETAKRVEEGLAEERQRSMDVLTGRGQVTAQHEIFTASFVEIVTILPK